MFESFQIIIVVKLFLGSLGGLLAGILIVNLHFLIYVTLYTVVVTFKSVKYV